MMLSINYMVLYICNTCTKALRAMYLFSEVVADLLLIFKIFCVFASCIKRFIVEYATNHQKLDSYLILYAVPSH